MKTLLNSYHPRIQYPEIKTGKTCRNSKRNRQRRRKSTYGSGAVPAKSAMIYIQISETFEGVITEDVLESAALAALTYRAIPQNTELTIVIEDDSALQDLNRQFLGIDAPTDVLSFPADEMDPDSGNPYLGDIIISLPRAKPSRARLNTRCSRTSTAGSPRGAASDRHGPCRSGRKKRYVGTAESDSGKAWYTAIPLARLTTMNDFFRTRARSFRYAFDGWRYVLRTQRNAWIHTTASLCVFLLGLWLDLALRDWAVIILTICIVWTSEFINTALETVVDLASPQQHPLAKIGKDVGAAAVLLTALASILVGLLILGPPLLLRLHLLPGTP